MSRIGKKPITIPAGTTVEVKENNYVVVKGPKGELNHQFKNDVEIKVEGDQLHVCLPEHPSQFAPTYHGRIALMPFVEGEPCRQRIYRKRIYRFFSYHNDRSVIKYIGCVV